MRDADPSPYTTLARELIEAPATVVVIALLLGVILAIAGG